MADAPISMTKADGVAVITLDDGKVNAITPQTLEVIAAALDEIEADGEVNGLVVTGRPGQFSAGFDLKVMMAGGQARNDLVGNGWDLVMRLIGLPIPVVTASSGNAVAAGAAVLLAGDIRLGAAGDFKIGFNETAIGFPLPGVVVALCSERLATEHRFAATAGARIYRPSEARDAGFIHDAVPADDLLDEAIAEAARLGAYPRAAFGVTKQMLVAPTLKRMRAAAIGDEDLLSLMGG